MEMDNAGDEATGTQTPGWLSGTVRGLEDDPRWDALAAALERTGRPLADGPAGPALRGQWLGHALHPVLTDLPLGCWQAAMLLDLFGGSRSRHAARRLIGIGILGALPTAAAGAVELTMVEDQRTRRVGAVHAAGNGAAVGLYIASWNARRRERHWRGIALGLAGGSAAMFTGFLGGHLSFGRGVGTGERGMREPDSAPAEAGPLIDQESPLASYAEVRGTAEVNLIGMQEAADRLTVAYEQVHAMVAQGLLDMAEQDPPRFRVEDVEAIRLQGG
jgi:uncharacterized membrane protein